MRRPSLHSSSVLDRIHTPILEALSQVCVLEDVSCNCNHQHSLLSREAFSIIPSLAWKYSNFVLVVVINTPSQLERYYLPDQFGEDVFKMLMCRKVLHMYFFLCIMSLKIIFYLNVFRSIMKHMILKELHTTLGYNHRIHLMIK
jgi:hypothetical protein